MTLSHLRELEQRATKAPWQPCRLAVETKAGLLAEFARYAETGNPALFHMIRVELWDGPAEVALVGHGPTSAANQALIVALRNAAPLLLALEEAARDVPLYAAKNNDGSFVVGSDCMGALRTALAALEAS